MNTLEKLQAQGFDRSWNTEDGYVRVACGQCEALVCNGVPVHELRCPNWPKDEPEVEEA